MKLYYKPKRWSVTSVSDTSPFITQGLTGTTQIGVDGSATNSIGDAWCLHNLAGNLGLPLGGFFQANYDSTNVEVLREPVEKDSLYTFSDNTPFHITDHSFEYETAKAQGWSDPYNVEATITINGFIDREARSGLFSDKYHEILLSPVLVVEDCDGKFFRVSRESASVSVSASNPSFIFLSLIVSSDFKFIAIG